MKLLLWWGLVPTLFVAAVCHGSYASLANPRYRIAFDVMEGCLCIAIFRQWFSVRQTVIATIVMLTVAWLFCSTTPWVPRRLQDRQSVQWKEAALKIEADGKAGEPVFVQSGLGETILLHEFYDDLVLHDYAACRLGRFYLKSDHPRYSLPDVFRKELPSAQYYFRLCQDFAASNTRTVWFVGATDTDLCQISGEQFESAMMSVGYVQAERIEKQDLVLMIRADWLAKGPWLG